MSDKIEYSEAVKTAFLELKSDDYQKLSSNSKLERLKEIANGLSADTTGETTGFYSKLDGRVIKQLEENPNLRMIGNTDVGMFLKSDGFKTAFYDTIGINYNDIADDKLSSTQQSAIKNLNSSTLYHPTQGMWADASRRFTEQSKDKAIALIGKEAKTDKIFAATAIPELIKKDTLSLNDRLIKDLKQEAIRDNIEPRIKIFNYSKESTSQQISNLQLQKNNQPSIKTDIVGEYIKKRGDMQLKGHSKGINKERY
jgi:hypothetical protein